MLFKIYNEPFIITPHAQQRIKERFDATPTIRRWAKEVLKSGCIDLEETMDKFVVVSNREDCVLILSQRPHRIVTALRLSSTLSDRRHFLNSIKKPVKDYFGNRKNDPGVHILDQINKLRKG